MNDLIRASALLTGEDEAEESFDEDIDDMGKSVDNEEGVDDTDMSSWEN